jgi:hypothetical protein
MLRCQAIVRHENPGPGSRSEVPGRLAARGGGAQDITATEEVEYRSVCFGSGGFRPKAPYGAGRNITPCGSAVTFSACSPAWRRSARGRSICLGAARMLVQNRRACSLIIRNPCPSSNLR